MKTKIFTVAFRRKREGKTNYKKRLALLKSGINRLVVRPSLKNMSVQILSYTEKGDKVVCTANSAQLKKHGWNAPCSSVPAAYLTGLLCGKKLKEKGDIILDAGFSALKKGCRIYAAVKGLADAGAKVKVDEKVFPSEDRIKGKHIEDWAKKISGSSEYKKQFSQCVKQGFKPEEFTKHFEEIKKKILSS